MELESNAAAYSKSDPRVQEKRESVCDGGGGGCVGGFVAFSTP